ncbi:MAG: hypothetical protein FWF79_07575 [Defluviitaleaceae bacterium]|nr:hypothetical protein [Defluviitaleaceae bacterium]
MKNKFHESICAEGMLKSMNINFIEEICNEENILHESLCQGYVQRLTKDGVTRHIFGAYYDLNSAASDRLACDKTACAALLQKNGVPVIPHEILLNPLRREGWAGEKGTWQTAVELFKKFGERVVLKPNQGTMGADVFLCESVTALETAAQAIFANYPDAAISPFREITTEYRVFFLNGNCSLVYGKTKGSSFQHNLSMGATAFEVSDKKRLEKLKTLALQAAETIGINFATIDIAESPADDAPLAILPPSQTNDLIGGVISVMEINSGVQARQLLEQLPHLRPKVKEIYAEAIRLSFHRA